jgi:queuine/archaeosine tRNA-ribosyltransferase
VISDIYYETTLITQKSEHKNEELKKICWCPVEAQYVYVLHLSFCIHQSASYVAAYHNCSIPEEAAA